MAINFDANIRKLDKPNTLLCELGGSIELKSTMELETILEQVLENGQERLIFDLSQVNYVNSQGLSAFLTVQKKLSQTGGGVIIVGASKRVRYVIDLTGFDQAINIYDDLAQAFVHDELFY